MCLAMFFWLRRPDKHYSTKSFVGASRVHTSDCHAARHAPDSPSAPRTRIVGRRGHRLVVALGVESAAAERRLPLTDGPTK